MELSRTLKAMEVHFRPDLQAKLDELAAETGRPAGELLEDVVAGYFDELARTRDMLDSRYDDLKSGSVKLIDGEEALARLKARTEAQRNRPA
jgi:predicted transcriptional regulator